MHRADVALRRFGMGSRDRLAIAAAPAPRQSQIGSIGSCGSQHSHTAPQSCRCSWSAPAICSGSVRNRTITCCSSTSGDAVDSSQPFAVQIFVRNRTITWCSSASGDAFVESSRPFAVQMSVRDYELDRYGVSRPERSSAPLAKE